MNTYRKLLADAIESNCGYSSGYHERYALAWNVKIGSGVPDWGTRDFKDSVIERMKENFGGDVAALTEDQLAKFGEDWDEQDSQNRVWEWVMEDMQSGVTEDDTYRTWSPAVERRYGFGHDPIGKPVLERYKRIQGEMCYYPAKVAGWQRLGVEAPDYFFDVKWTFTGRSGGYIALEEFQHVGLKQTSESLAGAIRDDEEGNFSNKWCHELLAMIAEWDSNFNRKNVHAEFLYQCAYRAAEKLSELVEETVAANKEAAEVQVWAERDVVTK